jgi:cytochrome c nitrite reductase small subunit
LVVVGFAVGLMGYTFVYARGYSYLTNDPSACVNCHVMREQYDGWIASSHRRAAGCNDCHTPHDVVGKWSTKALNGFWQVVHQGAERLLALVLLHHGDVPRADPHQRAQPGHHRVRVSILPR